MMGGSLDFELAPTEQSYSCKTLLDLWGELAPGRGLNLTHFMACPVNARCLPNPVTDPQNYYLAKGVTEQNGWAVYKPAIAAACPGFFGP